MSQIIETEGQIAAALDRLRTAVASRYAPTDGDDTTLVARVTQLEQEKAALAGELERLRAKRDIDVAALDELISQLKPLIEEA